MEEEDGGRSLAETPTWAVATVVSVMVALGLFFQVSLEQFGKWLDRSKRKSLLAALDKIKEELMLFGLLSLLMGHWIIFVAKICIKSSTPSSHVYACLPGTNISHLVSLKHSTISTSSYPIYSVSHEQVNNMGSEFCSEGHDSFASYESLEQLHRFMFLLGVTHISYSFIAIALAVIKIYSWRTWENQARSIVEEEGARAENLGTRMRRLSSFIFHRTSHPWSQHRFLVWLLCFSRQFWSSINRVDYMAMRFVFITTHQLSPSYDFHNYMLRSIEEEFRDIVGISVPLWIFTMLCLFLGFHGTDVYFWLSFLPAILILVIGTKLHRIVVKLAVEILERSPWTGDHHFNLRDELFWFGNPRLLLRLIQFITFQNALELAMFVWSWWESKGHSCFMENLSFIAVRLTFGLVSQFWCSFITFPLYVIVTQMGSRFKRSLLSENVRRSLQKWRRRVKTRHGSPRFTLLRSPRSTTSWDSLLGGMDRNNSVRSNPSSRWEDTPGSTRQASIARDQTSEVSSGEEKKLKVPLSYWLGRDSYVDTIDDHTGNSDTKDSSCPFPPP